MTTPDPWAALRKPFPREAIGRLPKGGTMLDYVGHAAVTDRLLSVDPTWTWEPLALTPEGLPMLDRAGNLWIKLTVNGVTRLGVGDGKNAKELIGDALRNAAMRFGVALDLWSKEELEGVTEHVERPSDADRRRPASEPTPAPASPSEASAAAPMTAKTRGRLFALFTERNITDPATQRAGIARVIGREIASRSELTEAEARRVIATLEAPRE